ncbi:hypothetical protein D3C73_1339720 [compost metagenome]
MEAFGQRQISSIVLSACSRRREKLNVLSDIHPVSRVQGIGQQRKIGDGCNQNDPV